MTQVEALARYAARAKFDDLSAESRKQLPVHILDSLGCCLAALGAGPVQACREQVAEFGGTGPSTLIGGGKANPIYAAFWHTVLVRYVDFMDNFLAQTETCHTADNFGVALTIADYVGGSGRDLMLGVALGYTVQSRFVDHANFMTRGLDHTAQLAFSHNAAAGRLLGLSEQQIGHAMAMAAVSDASFAVVRAKPLSQWKGLASAQSALGAMNTLFLARRGVEGPLQVIEGPLGIDHLLGMKIDIDWDKQGYEGVTESTIKKYNSMIHTQSAVHCMVELTKQRKIDPNKIVSIEARGVPTRFRLRWWRPLRRGQSHPYQGTGGSQLAVPAFGCPHRWRCDAGTIQAGAHRQVRCAGVAEEGFDPSERRIHGSIPAENASQDHDPICKTGP